MAIKTSINASIGEVVFSNGVESITVHLDRLHIDNQRYAALHGLKQKVGDAAAIARDTETGKSATEEEKFAAMKAVVEHLESGTAEWNRRTQDGERKPSGLLFEALCRAYPQKDAAAIRTFIAARSKAEQAALLNSAALKPHVDAIRAEAGKGVDTEELLAGL